MKTNRISRLTLCLFLVVLLGGCSYMPFWGDEDRVLATTIVASSKLNPNADGRPSPLVVNVYELKSVTFFETAEFFTLVDNPRNALGDDLIKQREVAVKPGDAVDLTIKPHSDTNYVGVVASYQDISKADWRKTVAVPPEGEARLVINLEARAVTLAIKRD